MACEEPQRLTAEGSPTSALPHQKRFTSTCLYHLQTSAEKDCLGLGVLSKVKEKAHRVIQSSKELHLAAHTEIKLFEF